MTLSGIIVHYFPKMSSILAKNILLYTNEQLEQIDSELPIFLNSWKNSSKKIEVRTSGSTGNPKIIELEKSAVVNSAKATNLFFNLTKNSIFLHCLPVRFIAGKMMVVRALQANGRILFASSFANPLENLNQPIDFCAMTAHQLKKSILKNKDKFNWIKTLIIGGGPIEKDVEKILVSLPSSCFHTFGMTETISHFAVREISTVQQKPIFKCLPNVTIKTNLNHIGKDRWVQKHPAHKDKAAIISAGPYLDYEYLKQFLFENPKTKILTVKHALPGLVKNGITPWGCIVLDPRPITGKSTHNITRKDLFKDFDPDMTKNYKTKREYITQLN